MDFDDDCMEAVDALLALTRRKAREHAAALALCAPEQLLTTQPHLLSMVLQFVGKGEFIWVASV